MIGRTAGTVPDFNYSDALAESGIVWTAANLDAFLADPRGFIPGNRMAFPGLDEPADRADVIAFLGEVTVEPPPRPAEPIEVVAEAALAPLLAAFADRFGAASGQPEPTVRTDAQRLAIAAFCADAAAPDLLGIVRRLRQSDLDACAANGVAEVSEVRLGHEALVLASGRQEPKRDVDLGELWLALSDFMPPPRGWCLAP